MKMLRRKNRSSSSTSSSSSDEDEEKAHKKVVTVWRYTRKMWYLCKQWRLVAGASQSRANGRGVLLAHAREVRRRRTRRGRGEFDARLSFTTSRRFRSSTPRQTETTTKTTTGATFSGKSNNVLLKHINVHAIRIVETNRFNEVQNGRPHCGWPQSKRRKHSTVKTGRKRTEWT